MAKLSKQTVVEELKSLGIEFDENAEYGDLCELLKTSKPTEIVPQDTDALDDEVVKTPVVPETKASVAKKAAAESRKALVEAVIKQQSARYGVSIATVKDDLHPQQRLEKQIRGFVMRKGGFREGLRPEQIELAKSLLKKAGRDINNPQWDMQIALPGYQTI